MKCRLKWRTISSTFEDSSASSWTRQTGTHTVRRTFGAPVWGVQKIAPGVRHGDVRAYVPAAACHSMLMKAPYQALSCLLSKNVTVVVIESLWPKYFTGGNAFCNIFAAPAAATR